MEFKKKNIQKIKIDDDDEDDPILTKYNRTTMNQLNRDCLSYIFTFLDFHERLMMEKICTKWRNATDNCWQMKFLDCSEAAISKSFGSCNFSKTCSKTNVTQEDIETILSRSGGYLKSLTMDFSICKTEIMSPIKFFCKNLENLELINLMCIERSDFIDAFSDMQRLKSIKININDSQLLTQESYYFDIAICILQSLPSTVEEISWLTNSIIVYYYFERSFLRTLGKLKSLSSLTLEMCVIDKNILTVLSRKKTLKKLSLRSCRIDKSERCHFELSNLEHLNLFSSFTRDSSKRIDDIIISILENSRKLKYVNIGRCRLESDKVFKKLKQLPNLEKLILRFSYKADDMAISGFKNLKYLDCSYLEEVTDASIMNVLENSPGLELLNVFNTLVTIESLNFAALLVKNRTPALNLSINADEKIVNLFNLDNNKVYHSPFLILTSEY